MKYLCVCNIELCCVLCAIQRLNRTYWFHRGSIIGRSFIQSQKLLVGF